MVNSIYARERPAVFDLAVRDNGKREQEYDRPRINRLAQY
jgi:hypothetical protein